MVSLLSFVVVLCYQLISIIIIYFELIIYKYRKFETDCLYKILYT